MKSDFLTDSDAMNTVFNATRIAPFSTERLETPIPTPWPRVPTKLHGRKLTFRERQKARALISEYERLLDVYEVVNTDPKYLGKVARVLARHRANKRARAARRVSR